MDRTGADTKNAAEEKVAQFYRGDGWASVDGVTEDARRWEDMRPSSAEYVSYCRRKLLPYIEGDNFILDMASGPIQYPEYLEYSRNFRKRYCVDLSPKALAEAERKIGDHGEYLCGSFFDMEFADNFFDTSMSLHTIYHMDADRQEEAVRKLLRITSGPVIILYANPNTLLMRAKRMLGRKPRTATDIYFHAHPISWWKRFDDAAEVKMLPWRAFEGSEMRKVVPGGIFGKMMLKAVAGLEKTMPGFFVEHFRYPMIVLRKKRA